jgi:hypothetical protein
VITLTYTRAWRILTPFSTILRAKYSQKPQVSEGNQSLFSQLTSLFLFVCSALQFSPNGNIQIHCTARPRYSHVPRILLCNLLLEAVTHPVSVELSENLYVTSKLLRLPIVWKSLSGSLLYTNCLLSPGHECNLLVFLTVTWVAKQVAKYISTYRQRSVCLCSKFMHSN